VLWWLHPVIGHLSSVLPGTQAADNVTFVWNLWWMRYVLHHPDFSFFSTSFLFYPFGTDLTLHTHTALPALAAAVAGPSSLIASQNLLIAAHLFLNFACSYALAYRVTRHAGAAFIGSIVFGASPFVDARLLGHFNLLAAWVIPLVALLCEEAIESGSRRRAALCGVALGATAYFDYYLFIYAGTLVVLRAAGRGTELLQWRMPAWRRPALQVIAVLLAIDLLLIAVILFAQTDRVVIGPLRLSLRTVNNPVTAAWLLILIAAGLAVPARVRFRWRLPDAGVLAVVAIAALVLLLPLIARGAAIWSEGRYVSQQYLWRSAPAGIDVATLALGNPYNRWWGTSVRSAYARLQIDPIESVGWIPVGALVLVVAGVARHRDNRMLRPWIIAGSLFFIWALGPWLVIFGDRSPVVLPAILIRYLPVVANARMPGRAMVVVYLAVAIMSAQGISGWAAQCSRRRALAWVCAMLIVLDSAPAAPPIFSPRVPARYGELSGAAGAVCELPLGVRDGFGEIGKFDSMVLLHQTVHQRPIVGGFVARLAPAVARDYDATAVIGSFRRRSSGGKLSAERPGDAQQNTAQLAAMGIRYIVVDTRVASADLMTYVQRALALRAVGAEDGRLFYELR
jgi:hypothetical protein